MQLYPMLVDGQSVQSSDTLEVINPATGRPFAVCSKGGAAHVDNAVGAARRAFPEWSRTSSEERKKLCHRLGEPFGIEYARIYGVGKQGKRQTDERP